MKSNDKVRWSSRFAFLMAAVGSAVGLANIWRFPYTAGVSGGSAFVLVYLIAIFVVAMRIMMGELVLGRRGRMSAPGTMRRLAAETGAEIVFVETVAAEATVRRRLVARRADPEGAPPRLRLRIAHHPRRRRVHP